MTDILQEQQYIMLYFPVISTQSSHECTYRILVIINQLYPL